MDVSLKAGYLNYEESGLIEENGDLFGVIQMYSFHFPHETLFMPDALILDGYIKMGEIGYSSYDGDYKDGVDEYFAEIRGVLGKTIQLNNQMQVSPYVGVEFRYLNDSLDQNRSAFAKYGYQRGPHYLYIPVGIKVNTDIGSCWQLT